MMHLDIAAGAFLAIPPETFLQSQVHRYSTCIYMYMYMENVNSTKKAEKKEESKTMKHKTARERREVDMYTYMSTFFLVPIYC
jgi:hypothetical protein